MDIVDITNIPKDLFVTLATSVLLIFSLLSFGILRFFQRRFRSASVSVVSGIVCIGALVFILNTWFA